MWGSVASFITSRWGSAASRLSRMALPHANRSSAGRRAVRLVAIAAVYLIACRVMLAPICNFEHLATAVFGGDVRLIAWTLAWDNHAVLARVPAVFDANIFYPASETLAYSEHLFGISIFTLPVYAVTH